MKYLKNTYRIIKYNFGTLAKFEIIYKILVFFIFAPNAGSFFSEKFRGEKMPLLEEALEFAKNNNVNTNVDEELVNLVHNEGKKLFVWTVNTEENINKMIDLNVGNIITDDYNLAVRLVNEKRNANLIEEFVKVLIL